MRCWRSEHLTCRPDAHVLLSVQHEAAHGLPLRTVRRSLAHWRIKKKTWVKSNVDTRGRREKTHQTISDYPRSSPNIMSCLSATHTHTYTHKHTILQCMHQQNTKRLVTSTEWHLSCFTGLGFSRDISCFRWSFAWKSTSTYMCWCLHQLKHHCYMTCPFHSDVYPSGHRRYPNKLICARIIPTSAQQETASRHLNPTQNLENFYLCNIMNAYANRFPAGTGRLYNAKLMSDRRCILVEN